ncbi:hypothetical protein K501DRAFT_284371 [Backusella circina FSU 941]|nr:hypothetical protein K501DRAFT_284371 [Backusella circina FSU 941]
MTSDTSRESSTSSATSQYHAQLYSGQKQLQQRHQEQQKKERLKDDQKPTSISFRALSFEAPNLYHTSLKLTSETDIHTWWAALVEIFSGTSFHATRITLSIPQDPNDPSTGPWGLKAVYNKTGSISQESGREGDTDSGADENKDEDEESYYDYFLHSHTVHETAPRHVPWCFDRLQPFESEPEPLINNPSVYRILKRNSTVVLSREYRRKSSKKRYSSEDGLELFKRALIEQTSEKKSSSRRLNWTLPIITTPCFKDEQTEILVDGSSCVPLSNTDDEDESTTSASINNEPTFIQDYDEYEQQQPSPWSQSPAPSPAIMDPEVNPFFQSPPDIDDEAFNPVSPESYDNTSIPFPPPLSNMHSIVHIPLFHPYDVINPAHSTTNSTITTSTNTNHHTTNPGCSSGTSRFHSSFNHHHNNPTPIAILSFLSPIVPYPPILLSSINSLSPFISASLTNAIQTTFMARQNQMYRGCNQRHRPNSTKRRSSRSSIPTVNNTSSSVRKNTSTSTISSYQDSFDDETPREDNDEEDDEQVEEDELSVLPDSPADLTPTYPLSSQKRPDHLGSMSTFTRSSLETVTEQLTPAVDTDVSSSSSGESSFSAPAALADELAPPPSSPPPLKQCTQEQKRSITEHHETSPIPNNYHPVNLSPSSVAILEGWGAVSPTTGLPISASIPPHTLCNNKKCLNHKEDSDCVPKSTEAEEEVLKTAKTKQPKRKKTKRRIKRTKYRRFRKEEDDSLHQHKESLADNLVAPKSSLLRLIIDGIPIHVFTCSTTLGQVTWVNNRIIQYTGNTLKDHLGPKWLSHMHPDDQPECKKAWEHAFSQGNGFAGEYRLRRFDGIYRCFLWRIVPLRDLKGRIIHWFGTCTDVHDQHVAKESNLRQVEIESNERKYRLLAEAIPQIVFTFSPSVGLTYANGNWHIYSGQSFEQTMGLGFMSSVHKEDRSKLQLPDLANKAGISWQTEVRLLSGQGEYKWFLVKCVSVDELDTGDVRWFGTCTDINDQKLLEKKLQEAHDAAQKSTESKTRFLSNMSHEIRTPLIGITGMLNFLLDTELTAEQMDYVHTIQQSAESLLVVINDILDLSKVEAGMMKLEWEPFSLITMIEDANELLSTLAIQKNLELSFWVDDDVPDVVVGDRVRLRQVLLNLIGNAIKFTTEGEIFTKCVIQQYDREESELTLLFEVVDTGTGFDASEESVMFKPFSQVDSSSTRKHGGSGLGLVISRQLIELHGGYMKCKSQKGKGSTFYFTVKFSIPTSHTRPQPHTPQNETGHDPFFRTNGYENKSLTTQDHAASTENNGNNKDSRFHSSPLAHSKKHSQTCTNDPSTTVEMLHDVLMTKAASMQLKPPPIRKQISNSSTTTAITQAAIKSDVLKIPVPPPAGSLSSISPPPSKPKLQLLPKQQLIPPAPVTTMTTAVAEPSPAIDGPKENLMRRSISSSSSSTTRRELRIPTIGAGPGLNADNGVVILPPRTPTRLFPLRTMIVSQWEHSRESMEKHVTSILGSISESTSKDFYIDTLTNQIEAAEWLADPHTPSYDYIMINLPSEQQILTLTRAICGSLRQQEANVLVVTTPMQRSAITESAKGREEEVIPKTCGFVFKPLKRTKLRWYFGVRQKSPDQHKYDALSSNVSTPDTPYRRAATQKEIFRRMAADVGGKGFRVLLVEDNLVNQKVLTRYLTRVGLNVDIAVHGGECIDLFFKYPRDHYSLILCDLFMPVKDGYETTREIREWEKQHLGPNDKQIPIVALSANVMSDVANTCLECGFSTYISKPVNFAILSDVIRGYLPYKS